jgi:hypothetical protein
MWLGPSVLNTVVFLGFRDPSRPGGIDCMGSAFLLRHDTAGFLVTARHVAENFGNDPFVVRVNKGGKAFLLDCDQVNWFYHHDNSVDLAIVQMDLPAGEGFDAEYLSKHMLLTPERIADYGVDAADTCYTVGLFKYFYGDQKNLPLVHSGNLALMTPIGEKIKTGKRGGGISMEELYLIETHALDGISGSPVFVRSAFAVDQLLKRRGAGYSEGWNATLLLLERQVHVLGLFVGTWFLPPDHTLAANISARTSDLVSVGLGTVVPAYKILELLMRDDVKNVSSKASVREASWRAAPRRRGHDEPFSAPDFRRLSVDRQSTSANPTHQEDFNRLLDVAAKTKPQDD